MTMTMTMTTRIRASLYAHLKADETITIKELYSLIEADLTLTEHDRRQSSERHKKDASWKRNIRNVIQSDKGKGWILVMSKGVYQLGNRA